MSGFQANCPVRDGYLDGSTYRSGPASAWILLPATVNVSPSIGRIVKDIAYPHTVCFAPDHPVRGWTKHGSNRQWQLVCAQKAHYAACALQLPELDEDEVQARLNLFIRIKDDGACSVVHKSGGQRQAQFAACRFLTPSLMKAHPDLVKLRLTHDAG